MRGAERDARVLVLALNRGLSDRILGYVGRLAERGAEVVLVVAGPAPGLDPAGARPVRVVSLLEGGPWTPLRGLENALTRPRRTGRLAVLLRRLPVTGYAQVRAALLAGRGVRALRRAKIGDVDAVVAADIDSVTLGYRLARRHPDAVVTTALNLELVPDQVS
ncbi:hypothetical protein ACIBPB_17950 [Micromonospora sp. NPDC049836]|uniref:hypothetical protein n=1 Tax=Micromonospora sp. NPDC049836 TaxID=3364274 RepID=UPI00378F400F